MGKKKRQGKDVNSTTLFSCMYIIYFTLDLSGKEEGVTYSQVRHATDYTQSANRTVSSLVDSSVQHRGNEAEPDSNEK